MCVSWLFSQVLAEEFSGAICSGGEPCAQLNVMPTAQPFWRNGKPICASRLSQFGLTLRLLTADCGAALLTWFRADFLVRTSASPAGVMAWTDSAPVSGERWRGSFAMWDPDSYTWRTHQCSLLGGYTEFSETWPSSGSMRNGECWEHPMLEHRTYESEFGFLPTPVTLDFGSCLERSVQQVESALWPTPTVKGNYNRKGLSSKSGDGLATAVSRDVKNRCLDELGYAIEGTGPTGPLNPFWVEWLMGWPIGWTALLTALGNGQVPRVAATAWRELARRARR